MKKLTLIIISIFLFFSIVNFSFSTNYGSLGKILDLETGVEKIKLDRIREIDDLTFRDSETQKALKNFKIIDKVLRNKFLELYKNGEIDYNSMNYVILNYDLFVYYVNKLFYYKKVKENFPNQKEVDETIISSLSLAKSYFLKVRNVLDEKF